MSRPKPAYNIEVRSPFPAPSYYMLFDWAIPVWKSVASDDAPKDREGFINYQIEISSTPGVKTWGVYRDNELGGYVSAVRHPGREWVALTHCIFRKEFWGGNTTTRSLRKIAQEIFTDGAMKIEMWVFADNHAIKGLIKRLGGREEGCLTQQVMREGKPADMCVYALTPHSLTEQESQENHNGTTYSTSNRGRVVAFR